MPKDWIQISNTDYYLKSDRLNWIVTQRIECKVSKSNPDGYKFVHETYHPELWGAFQRIFDETTKLVEAKTIHDILRVCEETHAMLKRVLEYDFKDKKSAA